MTPNSERTGKYSTFKKNMQYAISFQWTADVESLVCRPVDATGGQGMSSELVSEESVY